MSRIFSYTVLVSRGHFVLSDMFELHYYIMSGKRNKLVLSSFSGCFAYFTSPIFLASVS